jgi:membrane associated rhomboid family serine protease
VLPLRDRNPTSRPAIVTVVLILVNVGVYLLVQQPAARDTNGGDVRFTVEYAAIPCEVTHGRALSIDELRATFEQGDDSACGVGDSSPQGFPDKRVWLAVLFSMFLHGSLWHLGGNMLFLWIFGNNIEDRLGSLLYLCFYLVGGLVSFAAHVVAQPTSTVPVIGASGAIAAVMGAYLIWFPRAPIVTLVFIFIVDIRARWWLGFWFVMQFFTSANSGVAWVAHVGGFLFGAVMASSVRGSRQMQRVAFRSSYPPPGRWDSTGRW